MKLSVNEYDFPDKLQIAILFLKSTQIVTIENCLNNRQAISI